jgi:large subunit ribosomal protein L32
MPNPKWRHSKRRKRARRTHDTAAMPTLGTCKTTGEVHRFHHAYKVDGDLYYRGHLLLAGKSRAAQGEA